MRHVFTIVAVLVTAPIAQACPPTALRTVMVPGAITVRAIPQPARMVAVAQPDLLVAEQAPATLAAVRETTVRETTLLAVDAGPPTLLAGVFSDLRVQRHQRAAARAAASQTRHLQRAAKLSLTSLSTPQTWAFAPAALMIPQPTLSPQAALAPQPQSARAGTRASSSDQFLAPAGSNVHVETTVDVDGVAQPVIVNGVPVNPAD